MSQALENLNRRAFLSGLMVGAGGLLVPKPLLVAVPAVHPCCTGVTTEEAIAMVLAGIPAPFREALKAHSFLPTAYTQALFSNKETAAPLTGIEADGEPWVSSIPLRRPKYSPTKGYPAKDRERLLRVLQELFEDADKTSEERGEPQCKS